MKKLIKNKIKLVINIVKGVTGIIGTSLILTEEHPYWALFALALGATAHELILYYNK